MKRMIQQFRSVQQTYMPFIPALLATRAGERDGDIETEHLYLPSSVAVVLRPRCIDEANKIEETLRESGCLTALEELRSTQRAVHTVAVFRKGNVRGTKSSGRSFDIIKRLSMKGKTAVAKYRANYAALLNLRGSGTWQDVLQVLDDEHVRGLASEVFSSDPVRDYDENSNSTGSKRKRAGGKHMRVADVQLGSASFMWSWIWTMAGALDNASSDEMDGLIRVEYLKSRARVARSYENIMLIRDERERVAMSLEFEAKQWDKRVDGWAEASVELAEGVKAFAMRQASDRRKLVRHFREMWAREPPKRKVQVMDRIEVHEIEGDDSDIDDVSPAHVLRPTLPGMRETLSNE